MDEIKVSNEVIVPEFTRDEYLNGTKPFEWLYQFKDNKFKLQQVLTNMRVAAAAVGVKNLVKIFNLYVESVSKQNNSFSVNNTTDFSDQVIELDCGAWYADDSGVYSEDGFGREIVACYHPIMPIKRIINVDSGLEKVELAYKKLNQWRSVIIDKRTLASSNSIIALADFGIAVNSEISKHLVSYLTEVEVKNLNRIEEIHAVSRLGWVDGYGFSPYVTNLVFDGDVALKSFFESVKLKGKYELWLNAVKDIRKTNTIVRIMLAASFGSVLVKPCNALSFFVHLWGGTETGKTVCLMLAASVWANPEMGKYIHTFNSTPVGQEHLAAFVNSMPLILDELQIVKDRKDFDKIIYALAEGVGKIRGQKLGGLQKMNTWQNCFLTSGEMPISNASSGGGAINRIIEIDCKDQKLFTEPGDLVEIIKSNYGYPGKIFIDFLSAEENMEKVKKKQKELYKELCKGDTTEKQASAASIILTADYFLNEWFFKDNCTLTIDDISPFLSTRDSINQNLRALGYLYDQVGINQIKFNENKHGEYQGEVWGCMDHEFIYIIKSQFDKILKDEGYNPGAFLSWAVSNGHVERCGDVFTKTKRINGSVARCVWLKRDIANDFNEVDDDEPLPF